MSQPTTCELSQRIAVLIKLSLDVRHGVAPVGEIVPGADPDTERGMVLDLLRADISAAVGEFAEADERERWELVATFATGVAS